MTFNNGNPPNKRRQTVQLNRTTSIHSYADIKTLASKTGKCIPELLALSSQNDPFYIMPAQEKQAE